MKIVLFLFTGLLLLFVISLSSTPTRAQAFVTDLGCAYDDLYGYAFLDVTTAPATSDVIVVTVSSYDNGGLADVWVYDDANNFYSLEVVESDGYYYSAIFVAENIGGLSSGQYINAESFGMSTAFVELCAMSISGVGSFPDSISSVPPLSTSMDYNLGDLITGNDGSLFIGNVYDQSLTYPDFAYTQLPSSDYYYTSVQYAEFGPNVINPVDGVFNGVDDWFGTAIALPLSNAANKVKVELSHPWLSGIEGNSGFSQTNVMLTVSGGITTMDNSVEFSIYDWEATQGTDYDMSSIFTIPAGDYSTLTYLPLTVDIYGDTTPEDNENFAIEFWDVGAELQIGDANENGIIVDNMVYSIANDDPSVPTVVDLGCGVGDAFYSELTLQYTPALNDVIVVYASNYDYVMPSTISVSDTKSTDFMPYGIGVSMQSSAVFYVAKNVNGLKAGDTITAIADYPFEPVITDLCAMAVRGVSEIPEDVLNYNDLGTELYDFGALTAGSDGAILIGGITRDGSMGGNWDIIPDYPFELLWSDSGNAGMQYLEVGAGESANIAGEVFDAYMSGGWATTFGSGIALPIGASEPILQVEFSNANAEDVEGNSGTTASTLSIIVSGGVSTIANSIDIELTDGTATLADNDYSQSLGTITIPAGDYTTAKTIAIPVEALGIIGDTTVELDEDLTARLTNPGENVQIGDVNSDASIAVQANYLIVNDDSVEGATGGVEITPTSLVIVEGLLTDSYQVVLTNAPASFVKVFLRFDNTQIGVNQPVLTFTPEDWNVAQKVTVGGFNDGIIDANVYTIKHTVGSYDSNYNGITVDSVEVNVFDGGISLLDNGTFEDDVDGDGKPDGWKYKALAADDKLVCGEEGVADNESECAFQFSFRGSMYNDLHKRKIKRTIKNHDIVAGDSILIIASMKTTGMYNNGKIVVKVVYDEKDPVTNKSLTQKVKLSIPGGLYDYRKAGKSLELSGTPVKIVVMVKAKSTEGTFYVDNMLLIHRPAAPTLTAETRSELLPLPSVPDTFRD